jgi:hypothetical protein
MVLAIIRIDRVPGGTVTEHLATWQAIVDAPDQATALRAHLAGLLARDDTDQGLLDDLMRQFRGARLADGRAIAEFVIREFEDDEDPAEVHFSEPYQGPTDGIPPTVLDVLRVHNGFGWEDFGGGGQGFNGYGEDGRVDSGGWDWHYLEEGRNSARFREQVEAAGLGLRDVVSPIEAGQDWIIWHPVERNALGEPMLYYVSHESCDPEPMHWTDKLTFGQVLLRRMVSAFCE